MVVVLVLLAWIAGSLVVGVIVGECLRETAETPRLLVIDPVIMLLAICLSSSRTDKVTS